MTPRWRLFPKYALLIIALVGGLLIASGATGIYFSWRENEQNLIALQAEKAQAAAARIEQYILDIEHQLGWTAAAGARAGIGSVRAAPHRVPEAVAAGAGRSPRWPGIDPTGREQVRISRVAIDVDGSNDRLLAGGRVQGRQGRDGVYYGPVYFTQGDRAATLTIARAAGLGGGVTAAEVNLKFVWEVVSRIRIGERARPDVVDDRRRADRPSRHQPGAAEDRPERAAAGRRAEASPMRRRGRRRARIDGDAGAVGARRDPDAALDRLRRDRRETEAFAPLYALDPARAACCSARGLLVSMVASFFRRARAGAAAARAAGRRGADRRQ